MTTELARAFAAGYAKAVEDALAEMQQANIDSVARLHDSRAVAFLDAMTLLRALRPPAPSEAAARPYADDSVEYAEREANGDHETATRLTTEPVPLKIHERAAQCATCGHSLDAHSGHTVPTRAWGPYEPAPTHCSQGCGCRAFVDPPKVRR